MADAGDIYVGVHANTDPFDPELEKGLRKAAKDAENLLDEVGEAWGETLADATTEELGKHGKDFAGAVEDGIKKNRINIDGEWFTIDAGGRLHDSAGRFARQVGETMVEEVQEAFTRATAGGGRGGIFGRIGAGIADAIGAGFNISGRSPLIVALVPLIGLIGAAILGAVQAVNGLVAALTALPALLTAIGLQVAVVAIAFDGVGEAMSAAFEAKNAKELNEALKDLTPSAQAFVRSMLPVKKMWEDVKNIIQENFFAGMGDSVSKMLSGLIELTRGPFGTLARQMGEFFAQLANFFNSPVFRDFVTQVFPATGRWLQAFGPVFVDLLEALTRMATVAIPFLEKLGGLLNRIIIKATNRLNEAIENGSFEAWLDRMFVTLEKVAGVIGSVLEFIASLMGALDRAGGNKVLDTLIEFFERLAFFFSTPVGTEAMEGIVNFLILLTEILGGLIILIGLVFAAFSKAFEAIGAFLGWLFGTALPAVGDFFASIGRAIEEWWFKIQMFFNELVRGFWQVVQDVIQFFVDLKNGAIDKVVEFINWIKGLPGRIVSALVGLGRLLWDAGVKIIQGLWDGMVEKFNEAKRWVGNIAAEISGLKGPLDYDKILLVPAGEAIMGGLADGMRKKIPEVLGLAAAVTDTLASLNASPDIGISAPNMDAMNLSATQNINLNMGGLTFDGVPSDTQAVSAGKAVAAGAQSQLQQRDTRIAVRMI